MSIPEHISTILPRVLLAVGAPYHPQEAGVGMTETPVLFDGAESQKWEPLMASIEKVYARQYDPDTWTEDWDGVVAAWDAYVAEVGAVHLVPGSLVEAIEGFVEEARQYGGNDAMAVAYFDLMDTYHAKYHGEVV